MTLVAHKLHGAQSLYHYACQFLPQRVPAFVACDIGLNVPHLCLFYLTIMVFDCR